jgi:hypothetical protein
LSHLEKNSILKVKKNQRLISSQKSKLVEEVSNNRRFKEGRNFNKEVNVGRAFWASFSSLVFLGT